MLNFAIGETTKFVSVDINPDGDFEADENVDATLQNASAGAQINPAATTATATIVNDDDDAIEGTEGDDDIDGTNGDDVINGNGGNDDIDALGGNDIVDGGTGDDDINGGDGDDDLSGNDGDDRIRGKDGNDTISGDAGNDDIHGGDGDDDIDGGDGDDIAKGGKGNDTVAGGAGGDYVFGGKGDDMLFGEGPQAGPGQSTTASLARDGGVYDIAGASEITISLDYLSSFAGFDNSVGYYPGRRVWQADRGPGAVRQRQGRERGRRRRP